MWFPANPALSSGYNASPQVHVTGAPRHLISPAPSAPMLTSIRYTLILVCQLLLCGQLFLYGQASAQSGEPDGLEFASAVRIHQSLVQPGGSLFVRCRIINHGQQAVSAALVATATHGLDRSVRNFQIAARSMKAIPLHVRLPANLPTEGDIEILVRLVSQAEQGEYLEYNGHPQQQTINLTSGRIEGLAALGILPEPHPLPVWRWPGRQPNASYELAIAARLDAGFTRDALHLDSAPPPLNGAAWRDLSSVMLTDPLFFDDLAAVDMVRRYIASGGQVWITLDSIPVDLVRPLLGKSQSCLEVDTTQLNDCIIETSDSPDQLSLQDRRISSYEALNFKRVIQTGGRVTHRIDDWPVAIWMKVGKGSVLLTTLDHRAWIEPRVLSSPDSRANSRYQVKPWAQQLVLQTHFNPTAGKQQPTVDYPVQLIGNPILSRATVMAALGTFCLLTTLLAGALHVAGWNRMWLYALAPTASIVAALFMVMAAASMRRGIPEGVATLQDVAISEDGGLAIIHEQNAVYAQGNTNMELSYSGDGIAAIDPQVTAGSTKVEQDDFQQWAIRNQAWPPGTWRYTSNYTEATNALQATAKFTERGATLELPKLPSELSDPVIEYVLGDPLICTQLDGELLCDGSLAAGGDRFINGSLLTSEQQRRVAIYQTKLARTREEPGRRETLYGWTELWPGGPQWSQTLPRLGSALVSLPVSIERPSPQTPLLVPHGFIRLRNDPNQIGTTTAYSQDSGTWNEDLTLGIEAKMQFLLPAELTPFSGSEITLELDIRAPQRTVRVIASGATDGPIELVTLDSPSTAWKTTIRDPAILADLADGILNCTIEVSQRQGESAASRTKVAPSQTQGIAYWKISHFHCSVRGSVQDTAFTSSASTPSSASKLPESGL